jgi:subtilisin family serine protease
VTVGPRRALTVLALCCLALTVGAASSDAGARKGATIALSKHERALVTEAKIAGKSTVTLLVASQPGANGQVAAALQALGATVGYRDDALGYVRADVPLGQVDAALAAPGIHAVDVDELIPLEDPRPEGVLGVIPQPAPNGSTPRNNPYMPTGDTGAAQFVEANPAWDGRGVTIGIVDTGVSLDHPSLTATSTGERKIVDWVTGTHPVTDNDPTWVNMATEVTGPSFVQGGVTYTAPAAAAYRFGVFNERDSRLGGEVGSDVNRDGNPAGSSGLFAVLWNLATNDVYVDTNQNGSFADEAAMTDYKVRFDVGTFGTDNPATGVKEAMPFVVQTNKELGYVNIGIVSGAHGSHVAGIAAGSSFFGGGMSGAAPGAKIVSSRACLFVAGCTAHALFEGMVYVAKQANVDVINMSIGGLPALNDGNNARCSLYGRLIEQSKVQMYLSIGNSGPGLNTAGDPGVCGGVIGLGASITKETYLADYGIEKAFDDSLLYFSSRGPREDGGFKPDALAPGAAISTIPMWQPQGCLAQVCPVGFALFNGTSMAAPQAAGVGALLVSAAKAANVQHKPEQIRQALRSTARYITEGGRYQAFDQGNGLLQVGAAWNVLRGARGGVKTVDISSSVPVHTILNSFLATPGAGPGIYDREGVTAGEMYLRTYTVVRSSGPGGSATYNLSWVGNDGTFGAPASVALPKGTPVTFQVTVTPAVGIHSAILNFDDPSSPGVEYQTMNTVVAAKRFTAPDYSATESGTIARAQAQHFFYDVPANVPAFKVDMTGGGPTGAGAVRFLRWHPYGLGIDANGVSNCYNGAPGGCSTGSPTSRTTANPQAGVWEVSVDARRNSDVLEAPFTLAATILGASVSPNPDTIASATAAVPVARSYTLTNLFGAFTGRAVGTGLGSASVQTPTIAHHAQQTFDVSVAAGSTSLRATIGSPSDPGADLDLFVYNCTSGTCVLAGQNADGDSEESVTINNPAAGLWRVLVDGYSVPAGTTTYKYVDVFANPAFGSVSVTDANALRPAGASWTVPGTVTANAAPAAGRVLLGNVQVRTDGNVLVGSGDVIVESVTP